MNLEDMFGSAKQEPRTATDPRAATEPRAATSELASELHLELDDDPISNTLQVRGATPGQIQSIEWLVAANDVQD